MLFVLNMKKMKRYQVFINDTERFWIGLTLSTVHFYWYFSKPVIPPDSAHTVPQIKNRLTLEVQSAERLQPNPQTAIWKCRQCSLSAALEIYQLTLLNNHYFWREQGRGSLKVYATETKHDNRGLEQIGEIQRRRTKERRKVRRATFKENHSHSK